MAIGKKNRSIWNNNNRVPRFSTFRWLEDDMASLTLIPSQNLQYGHRKPPITLEVFGETHCVSLHYEEPVKTEVIKRLGSYQIYRVYLNNQPKQTNWNILSKFNLPNAGEFICE